jgi:hypothetical protein
MLKFDVSLGFTFILKLLLSLLFAFKFVFPIAFSDILKFGLLNC